MQQCSLFPAFLAISALFCIILHFHQFLHFLHLSAGVLSKFMMRFSRIYLSIRLANVSGYHLHRSVWPLTWWEQLGASSLCNLTRNSTFCRKSMFSLWKWTIFCNSARENCILYDSFLRDEILFLYLGYPNSTQEKTE